MTDCLKILQHTADTCIDCGACISGCRFLAEKGSPAQTAHKALSSEQARQKAAVESYECSTCGLCSAVCPVDARPAEMFKELRNHAQEQNFFNLKKYAPLLNYEKTGCRFPFRGSSIPEGCTTAFFPGCTLPALFPQAVKNTYGILRRNDPAIGLIFNCCSKPSKMLGLDKKHTEDLTKLVREIEKNGIKRILSACSNCHVTLKEFNPPFEVVSVFEELLHMDIPPIRPYLNEVTIHDPCVTRSEKTIHKAVRTLLRQSGVQVTEMKHNGDRTICCGEGGAVNFHIPEYSRTWADKRISEARKTGLAMATYCAGCVNFLSSGHPTAHILDLLTVERDALPRLPGFPATYANRLLLKFRIPGALI